MKVLIAEDDAISRMILKKSVEKFGLAVLSPGEEKPTENLLREADTALYKAKEAGQNTVVVYNGPTKERQDTG